GARRIEQGRTALPDPALWRSRRSVGRHGSQLRLSIQRPTPGSASRCLVFRIPRRNLWGTRKLRLWRKLRQQKWRRALPYPRSDPFLPDRASGVRESLGDAVISAAITGTIASVVSGAILSTGACVEGKGPLQPVNATSHWLHGPAAGRR